MNATSVRDSHARSFVATELGEQASEYRVSLVTMPFGPVATPSLALSILRDLLGQERVPVSLCYATIRFAEVIGVELYEEISNASPVDLLGDWLFADIFRENKHSQGPLDDDLAYRANVLSRYDATKVVAFLSAKEMVSAFIDALCTEVLTLRPRLVGFTSTFAQHGAVLAACHALKRRRPDVFTIIGGANCEGTMGLQTALSFPFVDAVVSGEGERVICDIVACLASGRTIDHIQGVFTRTNAQIVESTLLSAPPVRDLDALPIPKFYDFFSQMDSHSPGTRSSMNVQGTIEASRGCWWGAKHHCTFCGLNGASMAFRSKSPARFLSELRALVSENSVDAVTTTDNILDYQYFDSVLPELARAPLGVPIFFEVKANLRKSQVALLRAAGIVSIQPGIESLDTGVLHLMKKGVTALQNVQLLKWCAEFGVVPAWNILLGFPGEAESVYTRMAELITSLVHLRPPVSCARIRLDRFSPHFERHDDFGLTNVRPYPAYAHVYGLSEPALSRLAYYFDYEHTDGRDVASYTFETERAVKSWIDRYESSNLSVIKLDEAGLLIDTRTSDDPDFVVLAGDDWRIYSETDAGLRPEEISRRLGAESALTIPEIRSSCEDFVARRLMMEDQGRYLSLAVPLNAESVKRPLLERLRTLPSTLIAG